MMMVRGRSDPWERGGRRWRHPKAEGAPREGRWSARKKQTQSSGRNRVHNHVWALDFQVDQTADGKILKLLNIVDEHTREKLGGSVERRIDDGSRCSSAVNDWWYINYRPIDVWIATDNRYPSVYDVNRGNPCGPSVPRDHWEYDRFHQYRLNVSETWNGTTLFIDKNCARGLVASAHYYYGDDPSCYS